MKGKFRIFLIPANHLFLVFFPSLLGRYFPSSLISVSSSELPPLLPQPALHSGGISLSIHLLAQSAAPNQDRIILRPSVPYIRNYNSPIVPSYLLPISDRHRNENCPMNGPIKGE